MTRSGGRRASLRTRVAICAGTLCLGSVGLGLAATPDAAATSPAVSSAPAVSTVAALSSAPAVSPGALEQAYIAGRHMPAGAVAGIRAGSLHTASVGGVNWAIADFTPSASAAPGVQAEFQDGASAGVFRQRQGGPWQLVHSGPYRCGQDLPAGLSQVWGQWGMPAPVTCQAAMTTQRSAASRAQEQAGPARTIGQTIAHIALGQVGVGDTPPVKSFGGVDCDPYSTLVGALSPNADGCGVNTGFGLQDENEAWCSDFAKWVWQQAGVTADMSTLNAGSISFYDWGLAQRETMNADAGKPAAGDAVVFFPPGQMPHPGYADHVGIVTAVNANGTVNFVNGDFLGTSNVSVQYDTGVHLTSWAGQIWGPGEQWVLITPPAGPQQAAPAAVISGPQAGVAGTAVSFSARGTMPGGSITQYQWTFGDGRTANQAGPQVSAVFPSAGVYPVTVTATSSQHTVVTRTWDIDVIGASSAVASVPSDAVWYSTTPVGQFLFLPAAGGLAAESSDGAPWLQQAVPGQPDAGSGLTALTYPDPVADDAMTPHVYFRSAGGTLAQTYLGNAGWTSQTLVGQPEPGSAIAATTVASAGFGPAVFYFNAAGQLSQTDGQGTTWVPSTLSSAPRTAAAGSLALAGTNAGVQVFYLGAPGTLTVAAYTGNGWGVASISSRYGVAANTPLSAITTGPDQTSVFFVDQQGKIAEATGALGASGSGRSWAVSELPGTTAAAALAATSDLLPSGSPGQEVFWINRAGQPAVTAWNGHQWQTTTLGAGPATGIAGVRAYPVAGQPQQVFLTDGSKLRLVASTAPGSWTTTMLPDTAATLANRVLLYAATPADDTSALSAASAAGLPAAQVSTSFGTAWAATLSGNYLVIAVGTAALDALDYNTCGWANPSADGAGGTPFSPMTGLLDQLPGPGFYEDAAAAAASQTPRLAAGLAYYATHGQRPAGVTALPTRAAAKRACAGKP